ncbi:MAG: hypothetical protein NC098_00045 [Lachnoclostridium sp.]|nr:hypothetical protein [Lachnoclostridium sp.]
MEKFNEMQQLKRRMFAMRNGVVADALRKGGLPHKIIFGLNLPQLMEIAAETGTDAEMAIRLRDDVACRESRLLAPMIYPVESLTATMAGEWIDICISVEEVDILCHKLLRKMPEATEVAEEAACSSRELTRYAALRLMFNVLSGNTGTARRLAEAELSRSSRLTATIAHQLLDEVNFLEEEL